MRSIAAVLAAVALGGGGLAACASDTGTTITGPAQNDPASTPPPTGGPTVAVNPGTGASTPLPTTAAPEPTDAITELATAAAPTTPAAVVTTPAAVPASTAPAGTAAAAGLPAITSNATDFTKEPVAAAGKGAVAGGVVVRDLIVGTGTAAVPTDTVNVRYTGSLYTTGVVFDASWKSGSAPVSFPLNMVVPGFAEGIVGMKPGGRREIVIPSALGYGDQANGPIPANSDLVFIVDLVSSGAGN